MWRKFEFKTYWKFLKDWLKSGRNILFFFASLLFAPLFFLALSIAYRTLWTASHSEVVSGFGFAALIAAVLGAPFIIWRTWVAHKDYKVKEQGHITDRITKAVENLGAHKTNKDGETIPNLEVRIGGIFALERIARDSDRDHIQIMEILSAYIRENAPVSSALSAEALKSNPHENLEPRVDIQTALTVIGRRTPQQLLLEESKGAHIDLRRTNLQGASLSRLNFSRVLFDFSNLAKAKLISTTLVGSSEYNIWGVCFDGASFHSSTIKNLKFPNSTFNQTDFTNASLQNVKLNAITQETTLKKSSIDRAFGDASVILPEGMDRPKHWPNCILGDKFEAEYKKWREEPKSYTPPNA